MLVKIETAVYMILYYTYIYDKSIIAKFLESLWRKSCTENGRVDDSTDLREYYIHIYNFYV